jgi:NAD kinase
MNSKDIRIILTYRRSRLQELIARHNTQEQARFYIEHLGGDFEDYVREDTVLTEVLQTAERDLRQLGRVQRLERGFLPNYLFGPEDIVVAIGQDGLVANTIKYLDGQPVVAINPDASRYEGVLLPFSPRELTTIVKETINHSRQNSTISLAQAKLSDGQMLLAVNDFFIGPGRHTTASYTIRHNEQSERQMSSGVIVSTGLGITGWFRSIVNGSTGILESFLGEKVDLDPKRWTTAWDDRSLFFVVREPYLGRMSTAEMTIGQVKEGSALILESAMGEGGVIFSDGMLDDAVTFLAGVRAEISLANRQGRLVI